MAQSLTQLPETADIKFVVCGDVYTVQIRHHQARDRTGLFAQIMWIACESDPGSTNLNHFEKHGISFEAVIECCAKELENDASVLADICHMLLGMDPGNFQERDWDRINFFSKSVAGRKIADMYVEKIRNCDDWGELYDALHVTLISGFTADMQRRIRMGIREQINGVSKRCHKV